MQIRYTTVGLGIGALMFAVLSARLGIPYLAFGVVGCAIATVILCVWDKLDGKTIPILIFLLGLAFLYQSTLISNYLVGTDIHTEYYFYLNALDGWDMAYPHSYNTAIGTTIFAPFLTNVLGIPGYWIYKMIFPLLFALVPVILFVIYRKEFGDKVAFLAGMFFITLPTYTLEMVGLPRQMLGELMLAIVLFLVVVRPMRLLYTVPLLLAASVYAYLFHYITGPAVALYLVGASTILLFMRRRQFALRWLVVVVLVSGVLGMGYYYYVADGIVADNLNLSGSHVVTSTIELPGKPTEPLVVDPDVSNSVTTEQPSGIVRYFSGQEPLVRTALGLDFMEASVSGKVFRVLQYGTQLALILGCVWLIRNRRKVSAEYIAFTITAVGLIAMCVFLPRFSNIINVTRFYHLSLFLVSPLLIVGGLYIFRNLKALALVLIIPYMLFTTGVVFELAGETDIGKVNIPYSIALSNERVNMIGTYTGNDLAVRDYAMEQDYSVLLADINGMLLLSEVADPFSYLYTPTHDFENYPIEPDVHLWGYIPGDVGELPDGGFTYLVYLTEWNTQNGLLVFKPSWYAPEDTASGMRQSYSFEFVGLPDGFIEVYRQGDAVLLRSCDVTTKEL